MLSEQRITIIGTGKMGGTLAAALLRGGTLPAARLLGTTAHENSAQAATARYGLRTVVGNAEAARSADIVILAVKPQVMGRVLEELRGELRPDQLVISLAAAIPTGFVEAGLAAGVPVIRCMSNTPCQVGEGMSVLCPGQSATAEHMRLARAVFSAVGRVAELDNEALMDAVTRSLLGAAKLVLETGAHPAKLKDAVTTPAGTTVDGLMALEDGGLRVALIRAVERATLKSKELQF